MVIDSKTVQQADDEDSKPVNTWPIRDLKNEFHYYMENGYMVFTEAYHLAHGNCCGNACRHCPYNHINVRTTSIDGD